MRKVIVLSLALLILYVGSAMFAVYSLARAVESGDGQAILAQSDQVAIRRSIVLQVIEVYDESKPTARNRILAQTVGATVADAMIEKFMTAENIAGLLQQGRVAATEETPEISINLSRLAPSNLFDLMSRFRISGLARFGLRLSPKKAEEGYTELIMGFSPFRWQVVGLRLPKDVVRQLAAKFP